MQIRHVQFIIMWNIRNSRIMYGNLIGRYAILDQYFRARKTKIPGYLEFDNEN